MLKSVLTAAAAVALIGVGACSPQASETADTRTQDQTAVGATDMAQAPTDPATASTAMTTQDPAAADATTQQPATPPATTP
jgi:hypothetical protein